MRSVRAPLAILALLAFFALTSCADDVGGTGLAINDPLALIDDVEGPLRLYVLSGADYTCDPVFGTVTPDVPDLPEGMFEDAVADRSLTVSGSMAGAELDVVGGDYVVLVRGKGTDPVTMVTDTFIASGCALTTIAAGETREVRITLQQIQGMGVCGDGVLSPDEQCEDSNTAPGDGCNATCRTEPFVINTTVAGVQNHPSVGGASGQRWIATYDSDNATSLIRLLEPNGATIATPSALTNDADIKDVFSGLGGTQLLADAAVAPSGRIGVTFVDFRATGGIRVGFTNRDRLPEGPPELAAMRTTPVDKTNPQIAFAGDGSAMVVFEDTASATGLSGNVFAAGSTSPISATPFAVGQGATGGTRPQIAGASDHFVLAFAAGGDVLVQRYGADGAARDAVAISAGSGSQAAIGALPDGRALVAWAEGGAVRGLAFQADGTALTPFDVSAAGAAPAIASGTASFAVAFTSGGGVRARYFSSDGTAMPNRDVPPADAAFEVALAGAEVVVSAGGSSTFMAVWIDGMDVHGRLFPLN
jgi:cysteine-rich repeat protein